MSLRDSAVLVRSSYGTWNAYKKDINASLLVEQSFGSKKGTGNYNKHLLKHSGFRKQLQGSVVAAYGFHISQTSPWYDEGYRIISSLNLMDYGDAMRRYKEQLAQLIAEGKERYESDVKSDLLDLGKLANPSDYPDYDSFCRRFYITSVYLPFPDVSDFRVDVPEEEKNELVKMLQGVNGLIRDDVKKKVLESLSGLFSYYDPQCRVYEAHRDKVSDMADLIPILNINNDGDISLLEGRLRTLANSFDSYSLRVRPEDKFKVFEDAKAIAAIVESI